MSKQWRCFHCDEVFTKYSLAKEHFGDNYMKDPICLIKSCEGGLVRRIRELQDELSRYYEEDSELERVMYSMQVNHQQALMKEEEKGYQRGMKDALKELGLEKWPEGVPI